MPISRSLTCSHPASPSRKTPTNIATHEAGTEGVLQPPTAAWQGLTLPGQTTQITSSESGVSKGARPLLVLLKAWGFERGIILLHLRDKRAYL